MASLLTFDRRIDDLTIMIKCWMKMHDLYGSNKITNYPMLLMILFYLQSIPNPIVPPIDSFQRNVQPRLVNGYNFAFDHSFRNVTTNALSVVDLLKGFFDFYCDFDFFMLISPLHGILEDTTTSRLQSGRFYIQDPFVQIA